MAKIVVFNGTTYIERGNSDEHEGHLLHYALDEVNGNPHLRWADDAGQGPLEGDYETAAFVYAGMVSKFNLFLVKHTDGDTNPGEDDFYALLMEYHTDRGQTHSVLLTNCMASALTQFVMMAGAADMPKPDITINSDRFGVYNEGEQPR